MVQSGQSNVLYSSAGTELDSTKQVQLGSALQVQELKDCGRSVLTYTASAVTGVTTEALISLTPYTSFSAGSAATTFAITAGKTLRLQQLMVTWRNNTAAAGGVTIRLRVNNSGAATATSPVQCCLNATTALTTIGSGQTSTIDFPDGFEISGTVQFGISQLAVGAVVGFDVCLIGFQY